MTVQQRFNDPQRIIALVVDVSRILVKGDEVAGMLQACCEAMVTNLDAAFARVWTLNTATNVLELQASAGLYTHLDGPHSRVPVGSLKIGLIAQQRLPHLTNQVVGDPRVSEQAWAREEGMVAFAGYPLVVEDRLIGVAAMFARHSLSDDTLFALSAIADSIALGIERIRAQNELRASLQRESQARVAAEVEQQRAAQLADELTRFDSQKDDFLSAAAHDLKTPLASISGHAQILLRWLGRGQEIPAERAQEALRRIVDSSQRMTALIDGLLDLTRLELGQPLELRRREVDLVDLVARQVAHHQAITEYHHITLKPDVPELIGMWDANRLERVVSNLLSNAIKYSPDGGTIATCVSQVSKDPGSWALLSVQDQGIGIPENELPRVFERFFRGTNVPETSAGTGIGLAGVRQLVTQHGGTINVESQVGKGSIFTVRLPLQPPPSPPLESPNSFSRQTGP